MAVKSPDSREENQVQFSSLPQWPANIFVYKPRDIVVSLALSGLNKIMVHVHMCREMPIRIKTFQNKNEHKLYSQSAMTVYLLQ